MQGTYPFENNIANVKGIQDPRPVSVREVERHINAGCLGQPNVPSIEVGEDVKDAHDWDKTAVILEDVSVSVSHCITFEKNEQTHQLSDRFLLIVGDSDPLRQFFRRVLNSLFLRISSHDVLLHEGGLQCRSLRMTILCGAEEI
jgi:hypothetical protein